MSNEAHPAAVVPNPPVNAGGQTAVPITTDALELALMGAASPAPVSPTEEAPTPGAPPDPANPDAPSAGVETGNEITTEAPTDGEPGDTPGATDDGEDKQVLSQTNTGDAELDAVLTGLTPAMRAKVVEVGRLLESGALKPGEVPRIGQLLAERHEMAESISTLQKENEELKTARETGGDTPPLQSTLPPEVAKLKTVGEVKARAVLARQSVRALESFLLRNPEGGEVGGKVLAREEIVDKLDYWKTELDALPDRAEQLQTQADAQAQLQQFNNVARQNHPWLNDPENAEAKAVREFVKQNPGTTLLSAAAYLRGLKSLENEFKTRNGQANGNGKAAVKAPFGTAARGDTRPTALQGKVPLGKPHAPNGSAAPKPVPIKFIPPKPGTRITEDHLENALLAARPAA